MHEFHSHNFYCGGMNKKSAVPSFSRGVGTSLMRDCDPGNTVLPFCPLGRLQGAGMAARQGARGQQAPQTPSLQPLPTIPPSIPRRRSSLTLRQRWDCRAQPGPSDWGGDLQPANSQLFSGLQTVSKTLAWTRTTRNLGNLNCFWICWGRWCP